MIMIAGGSGRLGRLLTTRLAARGEAVRVLSRTLRPGGAGAPPGVEILAGDIRRPADVERAVAGARIVISAMSAFGLKDVTPKQIDRGGNLALIAACERQDVEHVVLVSVRGAAADAPTGLARMKYAAEQRLARSTLSWTIVRPSPFIETFQQVLCVPLLSTGKTIVFGRATNPVNFVSAHDVAWCVDRSCTDATLRGAAIEVGGPENLSLLQFVEIFAAVTGTPGPVTHIPRAMMRLTSLVARPFDPTFARKAEAAVMMDTSDMTFDPADLRRRFPDLALLSAADVARRDYAAAARGVQA